MGLSVEQLALLDETKEVRIDTGGPVTTIIWIVVSAGDPFIRSVQGEDGIWYQRVRANPRVAIVVGDDRIEFDAIHVDDSAVIDAVSDALRAKYPPGGSLDRMTRDEVLNTTLRLSPIS
ncbi:MAG TPA: DUF2255 family protein [Acidimicrobiia bacterium]|jgi:hypothetical protein|nr:DUF2255 family protein [Acidimicrobiia bacterium]